LTKKATFATPTLSVALAFMVTVLPLFTLEPFPGWVIVTLGGVVSGGGWLEYSE
jgi:hypothetical protein